MTNRILVSTITITRAEGLVEECDKPETVHSWEAADRLLLDWSVTAPKNGGYDKCDFELVFADGETYSGRYDLMHHSKEVPHLAGHVRAHCGTVAGWLKPEWVESDEEWERIKARQLSMFSAARIEAVRNFLRHYEIPGAEDIVPK